jgi:hypothetical protein
MSHSRHLGRMWPRRVKVSEKNDAAENDGTKQHQQRESFMGQTAEGASHWALLLLRGQDGRRIGIMRLDRIILVGCVLPVNVLRLFLNSHFCALQYCKELQPRCMARITENLGRSGVEACHRRSRRMLTKTRRGFLLAGLCRCVTATSTSVDDSASQASTP